MKRGDNRTLNRSFGLVMAGALGIFTIVRSILTGNIAWWLAAIGMGFALVGFLVPVWLAPVRRAWMKFAMILGAINSRILLTVVYFSIVTPLAILLRILGKRPIAVRPDKTTSSYWHERGAEEFTSRRLERQF